MYKDAVFRYTVSHLDLIIPGDPVIQILPDNIIEMEIQNDYDNNFFPIFRMTINLSLFNIYKIINNINDAQLHVKMFVREHDVDSDSTGSYFIKTDVMNKNFIIFMDDLTPDLQKQLTNYTIETTENDFVKSQSRVEIYLFDCNLLYNTKSTMNYIFGNCKIQDVISYLFKKSNITNTLLSPIDNIKEYDQLIIPPSDLIDSLKNLENMYGIYKTSMVLFFDFTRNYLLNKTPRCDALAQSEKPRMTLNVLKAGNAGSVMSVTNETSSGYNVNLDINAIKVVDTSSINNAIYGNTLSNIDIESGEFKEIYSEYIPPTLNKVGNRITVSNYGNPYTIERSQYDIEEDIITLYAGIKDFNINLFTPNKEYMVYFEDISLQKKYSGYYRLSSINYTMNKDGNSFRVSAAIMLKKSPKKKVGF